MTEVRKIKKVYAKNFMCYESIRFNMEHYAGKIVKVGGLTGSGKSTIFDIITWGLFGKVSKGGNIRIIRDIPDKQKICIVKIMLSDGVVVKRVIENRKQKLTIKIDGEDVTLRTLTESQMMLNTIVNADYKTFINSVYFNQSDNGQMLFGTAKDKTDVLSNLFNVSTIDNALKLANVDIKNKNISVERLTGSILATESFLSDSADKSTLLKERRKLIRELSSLKKEITKLSDAKLSYDLKLKKISELNELKHQLEIITNEIFSIKKKYDEQVKKYRSNYKLSKKKILIRESKNIKISKVNYDEKIESLQAKIFSVTEKLSRTKGRIANIKQLFEKFSRLRKHEKCPVCRRKYSAEHIENEMKKMANAYNRLQNKLDRYQSEIDDLKYEVKILGEKKSVNDENIRRKNMIKSWLSSYERVDEIISDIRNKRKNDVGKLNEKARFIKRKINSANVALKKFDVTNSVYSDYNECQRRIIETERDLNTIKARLKTVRSIEKKLLKYEDKLVYEKSSESVAVKAFDLLKRFKIELLAEMIPAVQNVANSILSDVVQNLSIDIKVDVNKKHNKFDVLLSDKIFGLTRPIGSFSGGEKAAAATALFLAFNLLIRSKVNNKLNFLVLDEKTVALDADKRKKFIDILRQIFKGMTVFYISHTDDVDTLFDECLLVEKNEVGISIIKK